MKNDHVYRFQPLLLTKESILHEISQIDSLNIEKSTASGLLLWDEDFSKMLPVHYLECMSSQTLEKSIYISSQIPKKFQIDKTALSEYLWNVCDKNAFITLDSFVIIWSEPEDSYSLESSDFIDSGTKYLYERFGDEYAFEIGNGVLGQLWFERNVVIVNLGEIVRVSEEIMQENQAILDPYFSLENQVLIGFLTTALHELRHLQMDTNIFLQESTYPLELGSEEEVENYCRDVFENNYVPGNVFPYLYQSLNPSLDVMIQAASSTKSHSSSYNQSINRTGVIHNEK